MLFLHAYRQKISFQRFDSGGHDESRIYHHGSSFKDDTITNKYRKHIKRDRTAVVDSK